MMIVDNAIILLINMKGIIFALIVCAGICEIYNFDYSKHGDDWEEQAPPGTDWSQCSSSKIFFI